MDTFEGNSSDPARLHKYLYAGGDPSNRIDPSGRDFSIAGVSITTTFQGTLFGMSGLLANAVLNSVAGGLLAASLGGFGAALEGKSPDQIEEATGSLLNISIGLLLGAAGSKLAALRLGRLLLTAASLGGGGWNAYRAFKGGHNIAALYYAILGVGGAVLANLGSIIRTGAAARAPGVPAEGVVTNPVPARVVRVVPADIDPLTSLGRPGEVDTFVTAAEDIAGMNAAEISTRLAIPKADSYMLIEFDTPPGIASPINRTNPGFVGFGQTLGGARKFVIPNGPIPQNANISLVH